MRQTFYDQVLERHIDGVDQLVLLGAGFDTRGLRSSTKGRRTFDVDRRSTVETKRAALGRAGVDTSNVTFVPTDFALEDWFDVLTGSGFDPAQPALFLWEGVTPYLDRTAVDRTLDVVGGCAKGSVLAFDYLTTEVLESRSLGMQALRASLRAGGDR